MILHPHPDPLPCLPAGRRQGRGIIFDFLQFHHHNKGKFKDKLFLPGTSSREKGSLDHGRHKEKEGNTGNRYL